jgi:hypothetical protein
MPTVFVASLVLIVAVICINDYKNKKKNGEKQETPEEHLEREAEYSEYRAKLVEMLCGVDVRGTKRVFVEEKYLIVFETEDGSTLEFGVDREIYELLEEGMEGTLVTIEGNFYGFEADN